MGDDRYGDYIKQLDVALVIVQQDVNCVYTVSDASALTKGALQASLALVYQGRAKIAHVVVAGGRATAPNAELMALEILEGVAQRVHRPCQVGEELSGVSRPQREASQTHDLQGGCGAFFVLWQQSDDFQGMQSHSQPCSHGGVSPSFLSWGTNPLLVSPMPLADKGSYLVHMPEGAAS